MKFPFFKALLISGAMLAAWNCSETAPTLPSISFMEESVKELNTGNETLYIADDNTVKNDKGEVVGSYNPATGTVTDINGNTVVENVSKDELDDTTISYPDPNAPVNGNTSDNVYGSGSGSNNGTVNGGSNTGSNTGSTGGNTSSGTTGGNTGSTVGGNTGSGTQQGGSTGGSSSQQQCSSKECFDKASNKCYEIYSSAIGPNKEQYGYNADCSIRCDYDPNGKNCSGVAAGVLGSGSGSNNNQPTSSASQQQTNPPKSSASTGSGNNSSTSPITSDMPSGATPTFKIKANGRSGENGWGSRYWDCCKPHCAWTGHGKVSRTCNANQQTLTRGDDMIKSICSQDNKGPAGLCNDQRPIIINKNLAYAYAAGPGNAYQNSCGACFKLTFNGKSRHTTDARTEALKGKTMVIMISNIGYDVEEGQFDMMIPGGGVGIYNGCTDLWSGKINGSIGAKEGGLLKDCGGDNATDDVAGMQSCLIKKCNTVFANIPDAKEGCLFHANWLMAANNPSFKFEELESCPQELVDRY